MEGDLHSEGQDLSTASTGHSADLGVKTTTEAAPGESAISLSAPPWSTTELLGIIAAFLALAVFLTWPLILDLKGRVLGLLGHEDLSQACWLYWWWKQDLAISWLNFTTGSGGLFTRLGDFLYALVSYPMRIHMGNFADFPLALPLERMLGFPAGFNLKILLIMAANALAGYALARSLTASSPASFIAGAILAWNPFLIHHLCLGRLEQAVICWLPLYILFLLATLEKGGWQRGALAGLFLGLAAIFYWYYGIFLLLFTALILAAKPVIRTRAPRAGWKKVGSGLLAMVLVAGLVTFPFFLPYLVQMNSGNLPPELQFHGPFPSPAQLARGEAIYNVATILSQSCSVDSIWSGSAAGGLAPSPFLLILGVIPACFFLRRTWVWLLGLVGFYGLSWGPHLKWGGEEVLISGKPVLLPYTWLYHHLPFFSRLSWPDRILEMVFLCLAVLVALVLARFFRLLGPGSGRRWLVAVLILIFFVADLASRGVVPIPSTPLILPGAGPWFQAGGVIELPMLDPLSPGLGAFTENQDKVVNFYQSIHGGKVLGKVLDTPGFPGDDDLEIYVQESWKKNTFLAFISALSRPGKIPPAAELVSTTDIRALFERGYRYVIIHERGYQDLPFGSGRPFRSREEAGHDYDLALARMGKILGPPAASFTEERWVEGRFPVWSGAFPLRRLHRETYRAVIFDLEAKNRSTSGN